MNTKHLIYCPFTGLGLYNGFRGNRWLKNRIKIFKQYVVPSLLNQSNQNFILWVSWRPEERNNIIISTLFKYLNSTFEEGQVIFNRQLKSDVELECWNKDYRNWYERTIKIIKSKLSESEYLIFKTLMNLSNSKWKFQYNEEQRLSLIAFNGFLVNLRELVSRLSK